MAAKPRILLGICGGIAAYKSVELVRLLVKAGYEIVPIMTTWGSRFVGPLTLEALTGQPVRIDTPASGDRDGIEHISLVRSAQLLLIAPLTANTAAKMAHGLADNFLTATYLAHKGLTAACPAMNSAMLDHPATRRNLATLAADGVALLHGASGELACGEFGAGRMAEPEVIADFVDHLLGQRLPALAGKRVLVSAGPTREDLDPVRFLTNRSSGKMGVAIARAFRNVGADVTLVHGPMAETPLLHGGERVPVTSAAEMAEAVLARRDAEIIVMAAAVADYRPQRSAQKLKKANFDGVLRLERTTDILATLGASKRPGQILVGFAAESEQLLVNAEDKLRRKNLDFIFANNIAAEQAVFGASDNHLLMIDRNGHQEDLGRGSKRDLAARMVHLITGV